MAGMTAPHLQLSGTASASASSLDDKVAAYIAAKATNDAAATALTSAIAALDSGWNSFKTSEGTFAAAMLTPPPGYTPPPT